MTEGPVLSPDGNFLWTGTKWIPAPPATAAIPLANTIHDSVIMGDVTQITNQMTQSFEEARDSQAFEILEKAKKIDHRRASEMFSNSWLTRISNSRLTGIRRYYNSNLKGMAPSSFNMDDITTAPLIFPLELFFSRLIALLDYDLNNRKGWILLAEGALEFYNFKLAYSNGHSYALVASDYFQSIGDTAAASNISRAVTLKKKEANKRLYLSVAFLFSALLILFIVI
jgi:hypothetical protein